jgi:hypothetical protein
LVAVARVAWDPVEWTRAGWKTTAWVLVAWGRKGRLTVSAALVRAAKSLVLASLGLAILVLRVRPRYAVVEAAIGKGRCVARKAARAACVDRKSMTSARRRDLEYAVVVAASGKDRCVALKAINVKEVRAACVARKAVTSVRQRDRECAAAVVVIVKDRCADHKAARAACVARKVMTLAHRKHAAAAVAIGSKAVVVRKAAKLMAAARRICAAVPKAMAHGHHAVQKTARVECAARRVVILDLPARRSQAIVAAAIGKVLPVDRKVDVDSKVDKAQWAARAACAPRKVTNLVLRTDPECAAARAAIALSHAARDRQVTMTSKARPSARKPVSLSCPT